jgi:antitoxin component YwqK of YwqJK toxin-antitoxin module
MKKKLLFGNFLFAITAFVAGAQDFKCDTSVFMSETTIVCTRVESQGDSLVKTYRNSVLVSERYFKHGSNEYTFVSFHKNGDTLTHSKHQGKHTIGLRRMFFKKDQPKRFTHFDTTGDKHGWEVFWYDNGNVKDSIYFQNDSTFKRKSFYYNGQVSIQEKDIYTSYNAVSYDPEGEKTGEVKDGTGTIFGCDSVGGDCKELTFKDGKRVFK